MPKIVLITGATSGIGKACAAIFAREKYNLILTGRRAERLKALKQELEAQEGVNIVILCFDVSDKDAVSENLNNLPEDWKNIDILLNNAGLSQGLSAIQDGELSDWETMIDTNVKGLLYVSKIVSGWMITHKKGHIINLGSIAAKEVYPNGNVYCATKHAVDALNKAMRIDLLPYGIKVTGIHPGAVETEFSVVRFKGDEEKAKKVYEGYEPLKALDIAETIWFAASRPAHVNISDLLIMPTAQASVAHHIKVKKE
jgi:3-hydroxy acid dehydrogenase/malonic semialdehyde reductase